MDSRKLLKTFLRDISQKNKINETLDAYLGEVEALSDYKKVDEIPFSSERKYSACIYKNVTLVLGAPEILLAKSDAAWKTVNDYTKLACRVVVFGQAKGKEIVETFSPLAVIAMDDPIREEAKTTLEELVKNNMEYRIISGDAPETVSAIAKKINPDYPAKVVSGADLDALPNNQREKAILDHNIFARIKPAQKQLIIHTLKKNKLFTIMIGDGVNDVLALKESDLGIAMNAGSNMAKDVADVVLSNNSFGTLPLLLSESRRIITNIQTLANLYLIKNISFIATILMLGFIGLRFPFDPKHVEITSLLIIGLPSVVLALEKHDFVITDEGFIRRLLEFSGVVGFINAVVMTAVYMYFDITSEKLFYSRTMLLTTIMFLGVSNLVLIYRQHYSWQEIIARKLFVVLVITILGLFTLVLTIPPIKDFFEIAEVNFVDSGISLGLSATATVLALLVLGKMKMIR